ncbi:hypothetical protein A2223_03240 [Candidatus Falkowbacteria bacterium RIFOXYA2_FULL_35_8]|uniref:Uncharacterized protein n=1 Tax=Candidatus Falkowbacteria bacterium RIFOXYC2_FULL_36_12 TaxID=1798002 RepID=A0A1F5T1H1_9BACT|nr:MAG: hypothetical protein A2478_03235 [Candidatus Falkowbacteria bacterium RIFOXYC2_FULL_36_12]OGF33965.1 MAG: hypothetical protein A2223_03240 [Candidatus Falkowbacteria bacterium RIFOXYA2_FULL_35_8]
MWILIILAVLGVSVVAIVEYESKQTFKKPAIYLYPTEDSFINVKLDVNGKIIQDIPKYENGWNVFVTKDGVIEDKYDYLFYEAKLKSKQLPNEGWIVEYSNLENWFDVNLIKLGLNQKEASQFKEYWLVELPKSDYYEIKLFDQSFLKRNMNLIISPQPDTLIRLNFHFKPLKEQIEIAEPQIVIPERNGFVVVEWGGVLDS